MNKPAPTTTRYALSWELVLNSDAVEHEKQLAGCFVLLTKPPEAERPEARSQNPARKNAYAKMEDLHRDIYARNVSVADRDSILKPYCSKGVST